MKAKVKEISGPSCDKCHGDPFKRMLHLLRMPDERSVAAHLKEEFGEAREKDGFIESELRARQFIFEHYSGQVDAALGVRVPTWLAFARSKAVVTKTEKGWHIGRKIENPHTPAEIRAAFQNYVPERERRR